MMLALGYVDCTLASGACSVAHAQPVLGYCSCGSVHVGLSAGLPPRTGRCGCCRQ